MASGKWCEHYKALTSDREGGKERQVTEFSNYQTVCPLHAMFIPAMYKGQLILTALWRQNQGNGVTGWFDFFLDTVVACKL